MKVDNVASPAAAVGGERSSQPGHPSTLMPSGPCTTAEIKEGSGRVRGEGQKKGDKLWSLQEDGFKWRVNLSATSTTSVEIWRWLHKTLLLAESSDRVSASCRAH